MPCRSQKCQFYQRINEGERRSKDLSRLRLIAELSISRAFASGTCDASFTSVLCEPSNEASTDSSVT